MVWWGVATEILAPAAVEGQCSHAASKLVRRCAGAPLELARPAVDDDLDARHGTAGHAGGCGSASLVSVSSSITPFCSPYPGFAPLAGSSFTNNSWGLSKGGPWTGTPFENHLKIHRHFYRAHACFVKYFLMSEKLQHISLLILIDILISHAASHQSICA